MREKIIVINKSFYTLCTTLKYILFQKILHFYFRDITQNIIKRVNLGRTREAICETYVGDAYQISQHQKCISHQCRTMGGSRKLDANKVSDPDLERLMYVRYIRANIMGKTKRNTT